MRSRAKTDNQSPLPRLQSKVIVPGVAMQGTAAKLDEAKVRFRAALGRRRRTARVNRTQRPNTWLHRPSLQRDDSHCQPGAVHIWHEAADLGCPLFGR
jgi:hypothetical protein